MTENEGTTYTVVHSFWYGVGPLQVNPCWKVHQSLLKQIINTIIRITVVVVVEVIVNKKNDKKCTSSPCCLIVIVGIQHRPQRRSSVKVEKCTVCYEIG